MRPNFAYAATLVAWSLLPTVLGGRSQADELSAAPTTIRDGETGFIILQDGGVLEGRITHVAEWYVVARAGSQMQVAAARVQYVCRNLHEAYEYRCKRITKPTGDTHLAMADWCLRYKLLDEAESEFKGARELGANEIKLGLLERRLAAAKARPAQPVAKSTMPAAPVTPVAKAPPKATTPDLPPGVLEQFTRRVQPILVNGCTAAKCHEPGGRESFQLNRALLRGEANRRTTMQNLLATLALIDREHPGASELLTVPRQTHGGMNGPVFGPRQEQAFKHVADWVALVAPPPRAAEPSADNPESIAANAPVDGSQPKLAPPAASQRLPYAQSAAKTIGANGATALPPSGTAPIEDPAVQPAAASDGFSEMKSLLPPHRLQYGGALESWQPRDPFDPEIFNRRKRAQRRDIQSAAQPVNERAAEKR